MKDEQDNIPVDGGSRRPPPRPHMRVESPARTTAKVLQDVATLVVEDDRGSARLEAFLLQEAGAAVRVVHTAEDALILLQSFLPTLVILDLGLPGIHGLSLVKQAKATPSLKHIPFIAVTATNGSDGEQCALAAGCSGYLQKPIDIEQFAGTVSAFLRSNS